MQSKLLQVPFVVTTLQISPLSLYLSTNSSAQSGYNGRSCGKLKGLDTLAIWPGYDIKRRVVNNKIPTTVLSTRPLNSYLCSNKAIHICRLVHYEDRAANCLLVTSWTIQTHMKASSHKYYVIIAI